MALPRTRPNVTTRALPRSQPTTLQRATTALPPITPLPIIPPGTDPLLFPMGNPGGVQGNAMAGIDWILNPSIDFNETDTIAAEQAVGGGFSGSGFASNNQMRLRDSERMKRVALGNELLQPYLQRSADSARQLVEQAGLDRRLSSELANRLQLALIQGDQQAAEALLRESGMDRRNAASIAGQLQTTQLGVQSNLLSTLLKEGGGGSNGGGDGRVAPRGTNNISSTPQSWASGVAYGIGGGGSQNLFGAPAAYNPAARPGTNPAAAGGGSGSTGRYSSYINGILRQYGLPA